MMGQSCVSISVASSETFTSAVPCRSVGPSTSIFRRWFLSHPPNCSRVQPSASASARPQPSTLAGGTSTMETSTAPAASTARATASAALTPGSSLSGQIATRRPFSGEKSALSTALLPPGQVMTATTSESSRCAASVSFSPSHTSTGASGCCANRSRPYSGRGFGQDFHRQPALPVGSVP